MSRLGRALTALPDALTACFFLLVWMRPLALGQGALRTAMLMMLVEFILVHASAFMGAVVFESKLGTLKRVGAMAGLSLFYLVFVAAWAFIFDAWWPYLAFGWLVVGKVALALAPGARSSQRLHAMQASWVVSVAAYVLGVFATLFIPLPELGIDAQARALAGLPGEGVWVDEPHRVVAFGALYFGVLAWSKWRGLGLQEKAGGGN